VCVKFFWNSSEREILGFPISLAFSLFPRNAHRSTIFGERDSRVATSARKKTSEAQKTKQARDDALVKSTSLFPRLKHDDVCDAFQQNLDDARVRRGQETTTKFARRPRDDHQSGRERLAENNRRKRRRDEEISVERSPTGGYSRHV
jgi:hypothetical protein